MASGLLCVSANAAAQRHRPASKASHCARPASRRRNHLLRAETCRCSLACRFGWAANGTVDGLPHRNCSASTNKGKWTFHFPKAHVKLTPVTFGLPLERQHDQQPKQITASPGATNTERSLTNIRRGGRTWLT